MNRTLGAVHVQNDSPMRSTLNCFLNPFVVDIVKPFKVLFEGKYFGLKTTHRIGARSALVGLDLSGDRPYRQIRR